MGSQKRNFIKEFIAFNIVGIVNTLLTYGIYSLFVFAGIDYRLALFLEYLFGMTFSFFMNRKFTFKHTEKVTGKMAFSMFGSYICVLLVNLALLVLFVEKFLFNKYAGQLVALAISVGLSFFAQKYIVFKKTNPEKEK